MYIFERNLEQWIEINKFVPIGSNYDEYGYSVGSVGYFVGDTDG